MSATDLLEHRMQPEGRPMRVAVIQRVAPETPRARLLDDLAGQRRRGLRLRGRAVQRAVPVRRRRGGDLDGSSLFSHGLGLAEALGLAAALGSVPRVVALGLEVAETRVGARVSARVQGSVDDLGARVLAEVRALSAH